MAIKAPQAYSPGIELCRGIAAIMVMLASLLHLVSGPPPIDEFFLDGR
jgi:hypothetical protein